MTTQLTLTWYTYGNASVGETRADMSSGSTPCRGAAGQAGLGEDGMDVVLHGRQRDGQGPGDLLVRAGPRLDRHAGRLLAVGIGAPAAGIGGQVAGTGERGDMAGQRDTVQEPGQAPVELCTGQIGV